MKSNYRQARENTNEQVTIGFGFLSDWLGGASFFNQSESVLKQNQSKHK